MFAKERTKDRTGWFVIGYLLLALLLFPIFSPKDVLANGWLRILEFSPANDDIVVSTYSPTLDQYGTDTVMGQYSTSEEFYLDHDMEGTGEDFTIVVLPDTQYYSAWYPEIFSAQTQWIVDNKNYLNIAYVAHEGDIVNTATNRNEWDNADAAMSLFEDPITTGLEDGIPYGIIPGNHDQPTDYYNEYFPVSRFLGRDYYGGSFDSDNEDNYILFSCSGMDFIGINLNYEATVNVDILHWADNLLKVHSGRQAILVSHYVLNLNGSFGPQGQVMYDALKDNPNLFLMLCGHKHGEAM
jgi:hypothetical protein